MNQRPTNPFSYYKAAIKKRTSAELTTIANIKRFLECMSGYPEFRQTLEKHPGKALAICREYNLNIDPDTVKPMWENGFKASISDRKMANYEHISLWTSWLKDLIHFRDLMRSHGETPCNPRFHAWRMRQMARCDSEVGDTKSVIVHSLLALELSRGCTVGCWFCGLKSRSFGGYYEATPENLCLWKNVLSAFNETLGTGAQTGFCYWGTEPTDNPDYLELIGAYKNVMGVLPQTTTARPTKDIDWTRKLIRLYDRERSVPARFSVLSRKILARIHKEFTADELLCVDLIQQHNDSVTIKAKAGRFMEQDQTDASAGDENQETTGTIACVSGFLVNMKKQQIELVSPCRATERWPTGYRVHKQDSFTTGKDIVSFIHQASLELMPTHLSDDTVIRFRKDLTVDFLDNGFLLTNSCNKVRFCGDFHKKLGQMIVRGSCTTGDIVSSMFQEADFLSVTRALQTLYEKGLLDDFTDDNEIQVGKGGD